MSRHVAAAIGPILLSCVLCALLAPPARALDREDLLRCAGIEEDGARLACYDALGERAAAEPLAQPVAPPPPPEPGLSPEERFGMAAAVAAQEEPERISARIVRTTVDLHGKLIFTLDNGQAWKQVDQIRLIERKLEERRVVLSKGALGSYWMKPEDGGKKIRVQRLR